MPRRVSHSLLDPAYFALARKIYPVLRIPRRFPPEGIVGIGHLFAILAAFGFAGSTQYWWAGLLVTLGVAGNHLADMLDGAHARATGQCRNGGDLLDHFTDPLSYSYWVVGLAVSCGRLDLGLAGVICLYATAVLLHIKARLTGTLTLGVFGATEIKTIFAVYGVLISLVTAGFVAELSAVALATWFLLGMLAMGVVMLVVQLVQAVGEVNAHGSAPDTSEWHSTRIGAARDGGPPKPKAERPKQLERASD